MEDIPSLTHVDRVMEDYVKRRSKLGQPVPYLRVFLARSDPALNYGLVSATLLNKVALQRLESLQERLGLPIYPIIGVGSVPFRGNFRPGRVDAVVSEYPSVYTFTVQSSFKFDHPAETVKSETQKLLQREPGRASPIDEERALELIGRYTQWYQEQVEDLAGLVNQVAPYVPARRGRRLHIGLFGYSRTLDEEGVEKKIHLPRAITFCAALYSVGIPPEVLGLASLSVEDLQFLEAVYPHFRADVTDAARYANLEVIHRVMGSKVSRVVEQYIREVDQEHRGITSLIYARVAKGLDHGRSRQLVQWAAETRGFLG